MLHPSDSIVHRKPHIRGVAGRALIGNNVKKVIVSQLPFSVVAGARLTDGVRVPRDTLRFSRSRRGGSTIPHVGAQGESWWQVMRSARFRERRHQQIPYGHQGRYGRRELINDNLQGCIGRHPQASMVSWIQALRVWRKMPSNRCGHDATVTLGQYRCVCASCRGHDSCVREASTHEQFAHVWCMAHRQTGFLRPPSLCGL
jgi:hypothetical protein